MLLLCLVNESKLLPLLHTGIGLKVVGEVHVGIMFECIKALVCKDALLFNLERFGDGNGNISNQFIGQDNGTVPCQSLVHSTLL